MSLMGGGPIVRGQGDTTTVCQWCGVPQTVSHLDPGTFVHICTACGGEIHISVLPEGYQDPEFVYNAKGQYVPVPVTVVSVDTVQVSVDSLAVPAPEPVQLTLGPDSMWKPPTP